jgi:hypothetical protein
MTDGMKEGWMDEKVKKNMHMEICFLQWNPLNLITLGPKKTDNINQMIAIN